MHGAGHGLGQRRAHGVRHHRELVLLELLRRLRDDCRGGLRRGRRRQYLGQAEFVGRHKNRLTRRGRVAHGRRGGGGRRGRHGVLRPKRL